MATGLRRTVEVRASGRCEYCLAPQAACGYQFHMEHCVPRSRGGTSGANNLALACATCNMQKGTRTQGIDPQSGATIPLFNPRRDRWSDHFQWNEGDLLMVAITPIGAATIIALDLNSAVRLPARRLWVAAGLLP